MSQTKSARFPYYRIKNYVFVKNIKYNIRGRYKRITYIYEIYNKKGEMTEEKTHRNKLPAVIIYTNNYISELQYWKHNELHREYGPAIIHLNRKHEIIDEEWFINNKSISKEEIEKIKKVVERRKKLYKLLLNIQNK